MWSLLQHGYLAKDSVTTHSAIYPLSRPKGSHEEVKIEALVSEKIEIELTFPVSQTVG